MIIRYHEIPGGLAVLDTTTSLAGVGSDQQIHLVKRTLTAADIGANAGQTQNAGGALVATYSGGPKIVTAILLNATDINRSSKEYVGQKLIINRSAGTISFVDNGATKLAATDILYVLVIFGY